MKNSHETDFCQHPHLKPTGKQIVINAEDVLNIKNAIVELRELSLTNHKDHLEIFTLQSIIAQYEEE